MMACDSKARSIDIDQLSAGLIRYWDGAQKITLQHKPDADGGKYLLN